MSLITSGARSWLLMIQRTDNHGRFHPCTWGRTGGSSIQKAGLGGGYISLKRKDMSQNMCQKIEDSAKGRRYADHSLSIV